MRLTVSTGLLLLLSGCGQATVAQAAGENLRVQIPAGLSLAGTARALSGAGLIGPAPLQQKARDPAFAASLGIQAAGGLEGYLAPGEYSFPRAAGAEAILRAMVQRQRSVLASHREAGRDERELLVLASLVQRETEIPEDRGLLASVFWTRLDRDFQLESQASLRYALAGGEPVDWSRAVEPGALALDHPCNTFLHAGLPPQPICSPGPEAIRAAAEARPAAHPFLFRGRDGRYRFGLEDGEAEAIAAVPADPEPAQLTHDTHYLASNEHRHDHFRPRIDRIGGVFIGVGTDQNFSLAAWARSELLVLLDFDQMVVDLHRAYRAAFLHTDSPEDFVKLWKPPSRALREIIRRTYPRSWQSAWQAARTGRYVIPTRYAEMAELQRERGVPTFLSDPADYAYVAQLFRTGRVLIVRGDLTAHRTMRRLAEVLERCGRKVRLLYVSNAEQYFRYTPQFRKNVFGLPHDERSLILRTRTAGPTRHDYIYNAQPFGHFRQCVEQAGVRHISKLVPRSLFRADRPLYDIPYPFELLVKTHKPKKRGSFPRVKLPRP
ncbi:MAG: endolytic transglycosylase MltG [Deltaproteobacteria bacterium]|nr:endolytic transglycosylase MltG [Deltaproteobacteria bacterium]